MLCLQEQRIFCNVYPSGGSLLLQRGAEVLLSTWGKQICPQRGSERGQKELGLLSWVSFSQFTAEAGMWELLLGLKHLISQKGQCKNLSARV